MVVALQGSANFQAHEVFGAGERPAVTSVVRIDGTSGAVREAARRDLRAACELAQVTAAHASRVTVSLHGDAFRMTAGSGVELSGEALVDRSCCTVPESRWHTPLATPTKSIVGHRPTCRFAAEGEALEAGSFVGENSAIVAKFGA